MQKVNNNHSESMDLQKDAISAVDSENNNGDNNNLIKLHSEYPQFYP